MFEEKQETEAAKVKENGEDNKKILEFQEILERLDALIAEGAPQASIIRHKAAKTDEQPKTITLGAYLNAFELYFGEEVSHVGEAKV